MVRFSKIKLLSDLIGELITSTVILIVVNYTFSSDILEKPLNYILYFTISFIALMMLLYIFFIFATPTMISIKFDSDHVIFKYVKGFGEKTVFYKDIKWVKKSGFFGDRYKIRIKDENIPLSLTLFRKNDRVDIVEAIKNRAAT